MLLHCILRLGLDDVSGNFGLAVTLLSNDPTEQCHKFSFVCIRNMHNN